MKKGISLVSLMITMVVMVAIISTVTISGLTTLNNNKKVVFATEINMLQTAVDTYRTKNNGELPIEATIHLNVNNVTEKSRQQFNDEIEVAGQIGTYEFYKIDYSALGITSLKYGASNFDDDNDIYVVSKNTGKVYYAKGLAIGSMTYYTLTDDLRSIIKANDEKEVYDGIIFEQSTIDWTLGPVTTIIRVPVQYNPVTVNVIGNASAYTPVLSGSYNVYTIDGIESNYTVVVNYTKDRGDFTAEYTIDNVDREAPYINKECVTEGYSDEEENVKAFLVLNGITDSLSGIKDIKFAYSQIDKNLISSYFKSNGFKVYDNVIELEKQEKYLTIYVEDNVGNFSALYYELSDELYTKIGGEVIENEEVQTYVVAYELNGGEGTFESQIGNVGETVTLYATAPTKEGYTFSGWKATDGTVYQVGATYDKQIDVVLTAQWTVDNTAPTVSLFSVNTRSNNTISFNVKAQDNEQSDLACSIYLKGQNDSEYSLAVTESVTSGTSTVISASSLTDYTIYDAYIIVSDGEKQSQSSNLTTSTACLGTGTNCSKATLTEVNCGSYERQGDAVVEMCPCNCGCLAFEKAWYACDTCGEQLYVMYCSCAHCDLMYPDTWPTHIAERYKCTTHGYIGTTQTHTHCTHGKIAKHYPN